jgi:hypothetical protein
MNELDDGRQTGANQGPDERTDDRQIDSKAASEPGGDATSHQNRLHVFSVRAIDRILLCELRNHANAPLVCWQPGKRSAMLA